MAAKNHEFEVEFIRLSNPQNGRPLGCVGIDSGDHIYLAATLHPSLLTQNDAGRTAFIKCHKAQVPVATFENGFYVEANWLCEELKTPFSHTVGTRTLTNTMLGQVAKSMVDAAIAYKKHRKNGKVAGKGEAAGETILLELPTAPGAATGVEAAND